MARKMRKFASAGKIGKNVEETVGKALASIGSTRPEIKADDTLKAAAPSRDMTRGEAFRYARMAAKAAGLDPSKQTFEYKGKTYNTRMAGEGAKRPAAPAATANKPATPAATANKPATPAATANKPATPAATANKPATPAAPAATNKPATPAARKSPVNAGRSAGAIANLIKDAGKNFTKAQEQKYGKASATSKAADKSAPARKSPINAGRSTGNYFSKFVLGTSKDFEESQKKKYGYKKGGSIDGCAIRGKTRAPMKKGK
jgi:hypothetical protein